jgi:N-acetylglucosaminyl-diphospho-decaprenol L-rhamnosyltransferase
VTTLSVVIVNYNTAHLLTEMFSSLQAAAGGLQLNCIVVDNASRDDSAAFIRRNFPEVRLITNSANVGFGRANNLALPYLVGKYVLLLNTDAFVSSDTLSKSIAYMNDHPSCGILGVKLVNGDGVLQPCARSFPTPWKLFLLRTGLSRFLASSRRFDDMAEDHASVRPCDWVPGCYYLIRRQVIDQIGLFDPRYFLYYEEVDHCLAAKRAGWDVVFYPDTTVIHIGGESAKSEGELTQSGRQIDTLRIESELLYFRKNHGVVSVWLNVLLATLGDAFIVIKRTLKGQVPIGFSTCAKHVALIWTLFRRTAWGTRSTR